MQRPAERGTLAIAVTSEGVSQEMVSEEVTQASNNLQALFKKLSTEPLYSTNSSQPASHEPSVSTYSMTNLRTRSWQPSDRNAEGESWPRLYEAFIHLEVTFRDFEKLAEVAGSIFVIPKVEIRSTTWSLTEETKKAAGVIGREEAIKDAISKAEDYARVLGRRVIAADVRDNGTNLKAVKRKGYAAMVPRRGVGAEQESMVDGLALEPQNVKITEKAQIRFVSVN